MARSADFPGHGLVGNYFTSVKTISSLMAGQQKEIERQQAGEEQPQEQDPEIRYAITSGTATPVAMGGGAAHANNNSSITANNNSNKNKTNNNSGKG